MRSRIGDMMDDHISEGDGSIRLPKWFLVVASALFGVFTLVHVGIVWPWATKLSEKVDNLSITLAEVTVRLETTQQLRIQIDEMRKVLAEHISDPRIHHAGLENVNRRLDRLESRIEKVEHR